jgi:hypothetical protein
VLQGADLHFVQVDDRPVDDHPSGLTSHVLASSAAPIAALRLAEPLETRVGRAPCPLDSAVANLSAD